MSVNVPELEDDVSVEERHVTIDSVINWQLPVLAILFVSVVFIAIKTVVHRHESRASYVQLLQLEKERDKLAAQWSRLKLEQATTLNQVRVEQYARWDLNMKMPKTSQMKVIQEPSKVDVMAVTESGNVKVSSSDDNSGESSRAVLGN